MTMQHTDPLVEQAMALDEDELFTRLGATQVVLRQGQLRHESLTRVMATEDFGMQLPEPPDLAEIGRQLFAKIEPQAYDLMCGTGDAWKAERSKIEAAVESGIGAVAAAIAAALALAGTAAAIAAFVAALIMKMIWKSTLALTCDTWKAHLPKAAS